MGATCWAVFEVVSMRTVPPEARKKMQDLTTEQDSLRQEIARLEQEPSSSVLLEKRLEDTARRFQEASDRARQLEDENNQLRKRIEYYERSTSPDDL